MTKRIGIFAGSFDPVHSGHIAFALQACKTAKLDTVYFLPERRPRQKPGIEHVGHRAAMITRAIKPYNQLGLLELPDIYFDTRHTLVKLRREFADAQLVMLLGSDLLLHLAEWPDVGDLLSSTELAIGLRSAQTTELVSRAITQLPVQPPAVTIIKTANGHVASAKIRQAIRKRHQAAGLLASVQRYATAEWLYASVSNE